MKAVIEYLGEWAGSQVIGEYAQKTRQMNLSDLMDTIRMKGLSIDANIRIAGHRAILGCYSEVDGTYTYSLEIRVPLIAEHYSELMFDDVNRTIETLKRIKNSGYYLEGLPDGGVECYKSGPMSDLEKEIDDVGELLSNAPALRDFDP